MSLQGWLTVLSLASVAGIAITVLAIPPLIAGLSPRYFIDPPNPGDWTLRRVGRHALGAVLVVAGLTMLLLPGQGVLTLVAAFLLLDVPGKHAILRKIATQPKIRKALGAIRERAEVPPLVFHSDDSADGPL